MNIIINIGCEYNQQHGKMAANAGADPEIKNGGFEKCAREARADFSKIIWRFLRHKQLLRSRSLVAGCTKSARERTRRTRTPKRSIYKYY